MTFLLNVEGPLFKRLKMISDNTGMDIKRLTRYTFLRGLKSVVKEPPQCEYARRKEKKFNLKGLLARGALFFEKFYAA